MRKIYFSYSTGYVGMDSHEVVEYPDDVTNSELDQDAWYAALQHAETYGIYPPSDDDFDEDGFERESEDSPCYSGDSIEGHWEEYDPNKHDGTF
jgi:hypothetical protein